MIQQKPKFLFLSPIFSTQDTFGIEQVSELPIEPSVAVAGDAGKPFVASEEATAAAQEVEKLAESVIQDGK
jgi:MinD-like ATPase involved in chromosome partitioning or flagellar assembly